MIVSRCPVRVSLAGGSTDLKTYLQRYGYGTVIGFSADVYCYITLKSDRLGLNGLDDKYVIDYMNREIVDNVEDIKNDIARVVLGRYKMKPATVWFTSDIYASGSGLASSTAYLIAMLAAVQESSGIKSKNSEICRLAHELEKEFNPLTGYQDPYVCGTGGFNRFHFHSNGDVGFEKIETRMLERFDMYLVSTGTSRSSTKVLETLDPEKCLGLVKIAEDLHTAIKEDNTTRFLDLINEGWELKKKTGKITEDSRVSKIDQELCSDSTVLAHRLLGAGNGGYFLVFTNRDSSIENLQAKLYSRAIKIRVCSDGPTVMQMR